MARLRGTPSENKAGSSVARPVADPTAASFPVCRGERAKALYRASQRGASRSSDGVRSAERLGLNPRAPSDHDDGGGGKDRWRREANANEQRGDRKEAGRVQA